MNAKQVARLCGVDASTVRRWLREGSLRGERRGGRWRIAPEDAHGKAGELRQLRQSA